MRNILKNITRFAEDRANTLPQCTFFSAFFASYLCCFSSFFWAFFERVYGCGCDCDCEREFSSFCVASIVALISVVLFSLCLNTSLFGVSALTFFGEIKWQGKEWNGELRFHPGSLSRISFCLVTEKIWGKVFGLKNLEFKVFGKVFGHWENLRESEIEFILFI